jgi:hypothetical protein
MVPFSVAISFGAFLLFLIQPLVGRFVLPWFGGSPGIWTVCLLFFQSALFLGYAYAHLLDRCFGPRRQITLHLGLLAGAILWLPPVPEAPLPETAAAMPIAKLLLMLATTIGPLFVLLSATGPLVQRWFHVVHPDRSPYGLYALSNLGSLTALLCYPLVFEPFISRTDQAHGWSIGFVAFIGVCAWCAHSLYKIREKSISTEINLDLNIASIRWRDRLKWLFWSAIGTGLLASITTQISADVAPVPFMWIAPITIYLLSFVVTFSTRSLYRPAVFAGALMIVSALSLDLRVFGAQIGFWQFLVTCLFGLAIACVICHAELFRARPHTLNLTGFYLTISAGGVMGTLWVAVISPNLFNRDIDLPLLWGCLVLAIVWRLGRTKDLRTAIAIWWGQTAMMIGAPLLRPTTEYSRWENLRGEIAANSMLLCILLLGLAYLIFRSRQSKTRTWSRAIGVGLIAMPLFVIGTHLTSALRAVPGTVVNYRGFHGEITVVDYKSPNSNSNSRFMSHGTTTHGIQLLAPEYQGYPTSYYVPGSGIGQALSRTNQSSNRHIGVVGLGVGTLAAYGMSGDRIRFFEIDPHVVSVAKTHFSFLSRSDAMIDVVLGDGRLMLNQETFTAAPKYDLLVLDAFSGDAVPIHLLTQEAFQIYLNRLSPDGILAINISNRIIDLRRAIEGNARQSRLYLSHIIHHPESEDWWRFSSEWLLLAPRRETLNTASITEWSGIANPADLDGPIWSDEFASILPMLR